MGQDFWLARWTGQASHWNETELRDKKTEEAMQEFVEETVSGGNSKDFSVVLLLFFSTLSEAVRHLLSEGSFEFICDIEYKLSKWDMRSV